MSHEKRQGPSYERPGRTTTYWIQTPNPRYRDRLNVLDSGNRRALQYHFNEGARLFDNLWSPHPSNWKRALNTMAPTVSFIPGSR